MRTLVDFDWLRSALPHDVLPERNARIAVVVPGVQQTGDYRLVFDLVVEGMTWFAESGSVPLELGWRVVLV